MAQDGGDPVLEQGFESRPVFYSSFLRSRTLTFFVGPRRRKRVIHKAVLAQIAPTLALGMRNSGHMFLQDVTEETFSDFSGYAYRGMLGCMSYRPDTSPECQHFPILEQHGQRAVDLLGDHVPSHSLESLYFLSKSKCDSRKNCGWCYNENCQKQPCEEFAAFTHILCKYWQDAYSHSETQGLREFAHLTELPQENQSCSHVLLRYANQYMLSSRYQIKGLKLIVSKHIHSILYSLDIVWRRIPDLIPFIRFIYTNTAEGDLLRRMVTLLITAFIEKFMLHPEFSKLLQEQNEFCHEVLQRVAGTSRPEKKPHNWKLTLDGDQSGLNKSD
ncbi:hypothetical protein PG987_012868 [Apiospora arundinis]